MNNAIDREKLRGWLAEQVAEKWKAERECDERFPLTGHIYFGEAQALKKVIASLDCGDFDLPGAVVVSKSQLPREFEPCADRGGNCPPHRDCRECMWEELPVRR